MGKSKEVVYRCEKIRNRTIFKAWRYKIIMGADKVNEIVKRISANRKVKAIFLFGSQANGRARKDSDFDIAVLTGEMSRKEELDIIGLGNDELDISVFGNLPLVIQFRALKEGKILFCRDEKAVYDAKVRVFKHYLDFSYHLNKFYRGILKNV